MAEQPYGPGNPDFDAEMRRRWLIQMREVVDRYKPEMTHEQFDEFVAEMDKIKDEFVASLNQDARPNTDG